MKIDTEELRQVAATGPVRFDMYATIHKAIRAFMADTLLAVGRMDVADDLEFAEVTQRVLELLEFCTAHLTHENEFVHSAIEARAPGASAAVAHDHVEHERSIAQLTQAVAGLRACDAQLRPVAALDLYRELSLFVAHNFEHMHVEETAHNAVLWARYTDAELLEIHDRLVSSIPPQDMMRVARWMVPFMNPAERTGMLSGVKAKAPPPAFQAILDTVRPHLTDVEWGKLMRSLGLPVAPAW